MAGTTPELLTAITILVARLSKSSECSVESMCFAIMTSARRIISGKIEIHEEKPDADAEESIDDIFRDIVGRSDL